jgi:cysteinyl-tRNA synthetase
MFGTHYRKKLDWSDDALAAAREGSHRLGEFQGRLLASRADSDSPRFVEAAKQLTRQMSEALDDDLNAPRAVAAMFTFVNEGNAALDAGERPGPAAIAAWEKAEGVLGVTSKIEITKITANGSVVPGGLQVRGEGTVSLLDTPPQNSTEDIQKAWALQWALRRKEAKARRDYPEADRIRGILREAGWEVRDAKDGSVEVIRIKRAS